MSESSLQIKLMDWVRKMINPPEKELGEDDRDYYPELWALHAIPNGMLTHPQHAIKAKREGLKTGVADLFLPLATKTKHGLYLELKWKKGVQSDDQILWEQWCVSANYEYYCTNDIDIAKEVLLKYVKQHRIDRYGSTKCRSLYPV